MKKTLFIFGLAVLPFTTLQAQSVDTRMSVFLFSFTKYINWPIEKQDGDFVMGVLGDSPVTPQLEKIVASRMVGRQRIVLKRFRTPREINDCHLLFVPNSACHELEEVKKRLRGRATLLVTEKPGLAQKGRGINFVVEGNQCRFELNQTATSDARLKVSSDLVNLAAVKWQ
jgi:hypothetical protein